MNDATRRTRRQLLARREELNARLERIGANLRRGLSPDSEERASQLADHEVVDALGNETRAELADIRAALERLDAGKYGICRRCGEAIGRGRLEANAYATECIDCARDRATHAR